MNILKTVLLVFGVSLLVSACAEDTIGNNGSAGSVDAKVAPTLEGPYIGDNSTSGNGSQDYAYMKTLAENVSAYANGTTGHPMLKNYFNKNKAAYNRIHNNWFDWNSIDVHGYAENNQQILPDENGVHGTNATKNGVRFPHTYHQDIARYTDLIGNCTTNCHIRFRDAKTTPYKVSPPCGAMKEGENGEHVLPAGETSWDEYLAKCQDPANQKHSKIVFDRKIQVGDSSYQTNKAHDFCWSCHANLPEPTRAPHGFIVTSDGVSHQPNGNCSTCHFWEINDMREPSTTNGMQTDASGAADVQFYGRPDVREDYFKKKAPLPTAFDTTKAHKYPDATETFDYNTQLEANPPQYTPPTATTTAGE